MDPNQSLRAAKTLTALILLCVPVTVGAARPDLPPRPPEPPAAGAVAAETILVTNIVTRAEAVGGNPIDALSEAGQQLQRRGRLVEAVVLLRAALRRAPTNVAIQARLEAAERARLRAAEEFDRRADIALTQLRFKDAMRESQNTLQLTEPLEPLYLRARARLDEARERLSLVMLAPQAVPSQPSRGGPASVAETPRTTNSGAKPAQPLRPFVPTKQSPPPSSSESVGSRDLVALVTAALNGSEFDRAAALVEQALATEPVRLDLVSLRDRVSAARRRAAEDVFATAAQRNEAGDRRGALAAYTLARTIDAALPGVDEAVARLRESMRAAAAVAITCGHVYEAKGRDRDATSCYERAIENLADDDPERVETVRHLERLEEQRR